MPLIDVMVPPIFPLAPYRTRGWQGRLAGHVGTEVGAGGMRRQLSGVGKLWQGARGAMQLAADVLMRRPWGRQHA